MSDSACDLLSELKLTQLFIIKEKDFTVKAIISQQLLQMIIIHMMIIRVSTAQGKWPKEIPVRENTGNLESLSKHTGKTQGIWFAQVVNSLIPKVKDISIFAVKISISFIQAG